MPLSLSGKLLTLIQTFGTPVFYYCQGFVHCYEASGMFSPLSPPSSPSVFFSWPSFLGVVYLTEEYTVCREGDTLTPEQARLLKLLDWKMAEFKISFQAVWSQDGTLQLLDDQPGDLRKELESS
jgi:hypothetical protein